jgi:hypothetical protein
VVDAKSFMEFFEKEYGVHFVDVKTGKDVLHAAVEKEIRPEYTVKSDIVAESEGACHEQ